MRYEIDPGKERRSINVVETIPFAHVTDKEGAPVTLNMTLMLQNGNSEMRLADGVDDEVGTGRQPVIVWINGAGWRECDKLLMSAEMEFLAEAGFALAFIQYRHSGLGVFPTQLQDCKTAVRFLRAHADEYGLDPQRVGVIGRSAGGHLAAWMAMNTEGFDTDEWAGYSSKVQAAVDMFGPADIVPCTKINLEMVKKPGFRWDKMSETHEGVLLGITDDMTEEEMLELGRKASPIHAINDGMCPILILHGDRDPAIPTDISEAFYARIVEVGLGDRADLYILKHGGHGTREFFQPSTKAIIEKFFRANLG
jgi:acetyl esterase/lipase